MEQVAVLILGAVLGAALTWLLKQDEYRRLASARWDADKRDAYVEFLQACNDYERWVAMLHRDAQAMADPNAVDRMPLDSKFERMQAAFTQFALLGKDPVPFAALFYMMALVPSIGELDDGHDEGPYGWKAVDFANSESIPIWTGRGDFIKAVRKELGLTTALGTFAPLTKTT
jgi:hypothetical protein